MERVRVRKEGEMWRGWGYEAKRVRGCEVERVRV